jgi:hypothetical protein
MSSKQFKQNYLKKMSNFDQYHIRIIHRSSEWNLKARTYHKVVYRIHWDRMI